MLWQLFLRPFRDIGATGLFIVVFGDSQAWCLKYQEAGGKEDAKFSD
jgi:hypothetical protein